MEVNDRTVYCGNLSENVTEKLLYELFIQAGPVQDIQLKKDKGGRQKLYAFITFQDAISVLYAIGLFQRHSLYGQHLILKERTGYESVCNPYLDQLLQYSNGYAPAEYEYSNRMNSSRRHSGAERSDWNRQPNISPIPYCNSPYFPAQSYNQLVYGNFMNSPHAVSYPSTPAAVSYPSTPVRYLRN